MKEWLQAYLDGKLSPDEIELLYHIGDDFSGETDFRLRGDGDFALWSTVTAGRARRDFAGRVDPEEVKIVARALLDAQLWTVQHLRSIPGEDDPEARIAVQKGGESAVAVLWVSEVKDVAAFAEAQKVLLDLIWQVSGGEVLEVGR